MPCPSCSASQNSTELPRTPHRSWGWNPPVLPPPCSEQIAQTLEKWSANSIYIHKSLQGKMIHYQKPWCPVFSLVSVFTCHYYHWQVPNPNLCGRLHFLSGQVWWPYQVWSPHTKASRLLHILLAIPRQRLLLQHQVWFLGYTTKSVQSWAIT